MDFLKLIRYKNLLMVLLTLVLAKYALIHTFLVNSYLSDFHFSILTLSVLSITAGGYIINDIYDIEADKINKPNKLFIDKTISKKNAWTSYFLLTFFGLTLGVFLSISELLPLYSLYFIFTIIGLFFYSKNFKKQILIGNIVVSFFVGLTFFLLISFELHNNFETPYNDKTNGVYMIFPFGAVMGYSFFSFLTTFVREIIKDIEDINGDLKLKSNTLPIIIGRKRASKIAFFFSAVLLVFLLFILQIIKSNILILGYGIIFILAPLLYFLYKLWFSKSKKDYAQLSNILKIIMLFGILSMLLFTIH